MRRGARLAAGCASALVALGASSARALDLPAVADKPVRVDVTDTTIFNWHSDNRNAARDDDHYGEWINRLDTKLSWHKLTVGFRLDSAAYYSAPSPGWLASRELAAAQPLPAGTSDRAYWDASYAGAERALLNRYRETIYPSKLYATWSTPELEATLGDFYVQFGRGLVLSLRKIDEVAVDTTLRGAKVEAHGKLAGVRWGGTLVGGWANPVRVDEASGRRLVAPASFVMLGMPTPSEGSPDPAARVANYRPDGIVGARIEVGTDELLAGVQTSIVSRGGLGELLRDRGDLGEVTYSGATLARADKFIETASVSLSAPRLPGNTAAYLEVAGQRLDAASRLLGGASSPPADVDGHAVYASVSVGGDPVNLLVELRHTRRFWPLLANTSAPEFAILAYSAPPTTGPITTDSEFGAFGTCTTGGRARLDARVAGELKTYASLGVYRTWAERNGTCDAFGEGLRDVDRNDVLDPFVGAMTSYDEHRSHVNAWGGVRVDQAATPFVSAAGTSTRSYYREVYARYDWLHTVAPGWAVQDQGFHRVRAENETDAERWHEGENYLSVQWASRAIVSFGYEYLDRHGDWLNFWNGGFLWRFTPDTSARLFVGQQRGALRCISGVCRQFPPFEGAKVEVIARF